MNNNEVYSDVIADTLSVELFDPITRNTPFSSDAMIVFFQSLNVMVLGMVGIFCFMIVFYLIIRTLDKANPEEKST